MAVVQHVPAGQPLPALQPGQLVFDRGDGGFTIYVHDQPVAATGGTPAFATAPSSPAAAPFSITPPPPPPGGFPGGGGAFAGQVTQPASPATSATPTLPAAQAGPRLGDRRIGPNGEEEVFESYRGSSPQWVGLSSGLPSGTVPPSPPTFVEGQMRASSQSPGGYQRLTNGQWVNTDQNGTPVPASPPSGPTNGQRRSSPTIPGGFEVFQNGQWVPISGGGAATPAEGQPSWWPQGIPYVAKIQEVEETVLDANGQQVLDPVTGRPQTRKRAVSVPDIQGAIAAFQAQQQAQRPGGGLSLEEQIADALARNDFARAQQLREEANKPTAAQAEVQRLANERQRLDTDLARATNPLTIQQLQQQIQIVAAQEARAQAAFATTQARQELENALARETNPLRVQQLQQQIDQAKTAETRAQQQFELERGLAQAQEGRAAAAFGPAQAREQGRFEREGQAQAFQQGQQSLQAGLSILRSPGDYWNYQTRLRGNQPSVPFAVGGEAVPRAPFLTPFMASQGATAQQAPFSGGAQPTAAPAAQQAPFSSEAQRLSKASGAPVTIDPSIAGSNAPFAGAMAAGTPFSLGGQGNAQPAQFSISPGLSQAFSGQPVDKPRALTQLGAPPFISVQQERNLLPSEREMRLAEVGAQGFYLPDFQEQEERLRPRTMAGSPFAVGASRPALRGL